MKPPKCHLCGLGFRGAARSGKLIYFQVCEEDRKKRAARQQRRGFVGHPIGAYWFCKQHFRLAEKFSDMSISDAMKEMEREMSTFDKLRLFLRRHI